MTQRYEYDVYNLDLGNKGFKRNQIDESELKSVLNGFASEGYELCEKLERIVDGITSNYVLIFKRPIE